MFNIKITQIVVIEIVILETYTFLPFRFNVKITQILEQCSNRDIYLNTSNLFAVQVLISRSLGSLTVSL